MPPKKIIAIKECSQGNCNVGDMWLETKLFELQDPIEKVWDWGNRFGKGKLIITIEAD